MSGGALDHVYGRMDSAARDIAMSAKTPLWRAFAKHLDQVSKALRDVEWVMSCDYGPDGADDSIRACLPQDAELRQAIADAESARDTLARLIKETGEK